MNNTNNFMSHDDFKQCLYNPPYTKTHKKSNGVKTSKNRMTSHQRNIHDKTSPSNNSRTSREHMISHHRSVYEKRA